MLDPSCDIPIQRKTTIAFEKWNKLFYYRSRFYDRFLEEYGMFEEDARKDCKTA